MLVGIHNTWPNKSDPISDVYREILKANKINYLNLDSNHPDFWEQVKKVDAFIYRWAHTDYHHQHAETIIPVIENLYRKPCFPNWATCWHYDDKVKQSLLLEAMQFPVCNFHVFWDKAQALEWIKTNEDFPIVFKLKSGSGSMQVKLLGNKRTARKYLKKIFDLGFSPDYHGFLNTLKTYNFNVYKTIRNLTKMLYLRHMSFKLNPYWIRQRNYYYFQKFCPGNDYDTRVQITGKRAFAFIRYNRPNDFRASGSNNWSLDHSKIDMEFVKIAFNVSKTLGFQSMAYDFMYDKNKNPVIIEISYCFGDYPEFSNGYWDESLNWHEGKFLPQYFELIDLLGVKDLVLPKWIGPSSSYKNVAANK
jgi:glutathione synthase/RimK-type ligase-like ATP-grasp enzyme